MDRRAPTAPPFDEADPLALAAAHTHWLELARQLTAGAPRQEPELWLGHLVLEVQEASERAVAAARQHADLVVAEAEAEALTVREAGWRRARALSQLRAALHLHGLADRLAGTAEIIAAPVPPRLRDGPTLATATEPARAKGGSPPIDVMPVPAKVATPLSPTHTPLAEPMSPRPPAAKLVGDSREQAVDHPRLRPRVGAVAVLVVLMAIGLPLFEHVVTAARAHRAQRHLATEFSALQAARSAPAKVSPGTVFASLDIPYLHVSHLEVIEGVSWSNLTEGPAHDSSSQVPGQRGAVVVLGHLGTYGAPFSHLSRLRIGDIVSLRTPTGEFVYRVSRRPQVLHPGAGRLVLPSATEVQGSGGPTTYIDQALVLATGTTTKGQSQALEVVVATLDQATSVGQAPPGPSGSAVAQLQFVPGQASGIEWALVWLAVLVGAIGLGSRLDRKLPPGLVYAVTAVVVVFGVYQLYNSLDRLVPGTH